MRLHRIATALLIALVYSSFILAQNVSIGTMLGVSNYQGDIVKYHLITRESNFAYGGFLRYNLNKKFSMKANVYVGKLSGSDANFKDRQQRGFSFSTSILEGGINIEYNPMSKGRFNRKGQYAPLRTPYFFTGVGAVYFKPKVVGLPQDAPDLTILEQQSIFKFMVPIGAGFKFDLNEQFTMGLEIASHIPFTDYLDGVSEQGKKNNDWYVFGGVTFSYWFHTKRTKRPDFIGTN